MFLDIIDNSIEYTINIIYSIINYIDSNYLRNLYFILIDYLEINHIKKPIETYIIFIHIWIMILISIILVIKLYY
jgi:hypothetical protein